MKVAKPSHLLMQALLAQHTFRALTALPAAPERRIGELLTAGNATLTALTALPTSAAAFRTPPPRAGDTLDAAERADLCASARDGVQSYVDLRAEAFRTERSARGSRAGAPPSVRNRVDEFPRRFRILYPVGVQARAQAEQALHRYLLTEDDPVRDPQEPAAKAAQREPAAGRPALDRRIDADLVVFDRRIRQADRFFDALQTTCDALFDAIPATASPADRQALSGFIGQQVDAAIDRARLPLADGARPSAYAPDTQVLLQALGDFERGLTAPANSSAAATAQATPVGPAPSASSVPTTAAPPPTGSTPAPGPRTRPGPDNSQRNIFIGQIQDFYRQDGGHLLGAPPRGTLPNTAALHSLGRDGILTFVGDDSLANALKFAPRQYRVAAVSPKWKYAPPVILGVDAADNAPVRKVRVAVRGAVNAPPNQRYQTLCLRGDYYRIEDGPWQLNPYPLDDALEEAKYLGVTALMKHAARRYRWLLNHDEPHDPRDFTGTGWIASIANWFGWGRKRAPG